MPRGPTRKPRLPSAHARHTVTFTRGPQALQRALLRGPTPRYPPAMLQIGVSGRVVLEFIVDTLGTVEGRSIEVVESSHRAFEQPAEESVRQAVFRPARLGSMPVRQRSRQPISFIARQ